jgi:hypothetical protein
LQDGGATNHQDLGETPILHVAIVVDQGVKVARLDAPGVVLVLQHFVDVSLHAADGFLQQSKFKN